MKPMRAVLTRIRVYLMLVATGAGFTGCATFSSVSQSLFMISPEEEVKLGKQFEGELNKQLKFVNDPEIVNYVRDLGTVVWAKSQKGPIKPQFFVVQDKEINAFAIPGGNVYVQTGLINAAEDEAELAAVMAHEVGHVVGRHGAKQLSNQQGIQLVQQMVLGTDLGSNIVTQIVGGFASQGVLMKYSRTDESEADQIAVKTLYNANLDPMALFTFFNKLAQKYGSSKGSLATLFASHPPTDQRMNNVKLLVSQLPKKNYQRPVNDLRKAQARLKQLGM